MGHEGLANGLRFQFQENRGSFAVGLRVTQQYDGSRVFDHFAGDSGELCGSTLTRPIQTLIWYPAHPVDAQPMTVGDYGTLWATETRFDYPMLSHRSREWLAGMQARILEPLWAVRDASPSPGRFPLVIYAPSFSGPSWENADLCEYLASHGYVVIASASMGAASRNMTSDIEGIEAQARDISFLIGYAGSLANADQASVAVIGFSWGGISNLFAAARDRRITALVALDGSLRYWSGLISEAGYVQPQHMTIPLLYFAQSNLTLEDQERYLKQNNGPNVLNAWRHGDLTTVQMLGMTHTEFSSMFQRNEELWWKLENVFQRNSENHGRIDAALGYAWMARYTRQFLNAYLLNEPSALAFLKGTPGENGVPRHVMNASYRPAKGRPASFDTFRQEIREQGYERADEIYEAMMRQSAEFQLTENELNSWAEELIGANNLNQAIAILTLCARIHPESSETYSLLGVAYKTSGQAERAVESLRNALEKDPLNADAVWKLRSLSWTEAS